MESNKKIGVLIGIVAATVTFATFYLGKLIPVGYIKLFEIVTTLVFIIGFYYLWKSTKSKLIAYSLALYTLMSVIILNTNLSQGALLFYVLLALLGIGPFFVTGRQKEILTGTYKRADYKPAPAKGTIIATVISSLISLLVLEYVGANYLPKPNQNMVPFYTFAFFVFFFLLLWLTIVILRKIK